MGSRQSTLYTCGDSNLATTDYHFVDRWRVQGTVEEVAEVLKVAADYPRWWRAVYLDVHVHEKGDKDGIGETGAVLAKGWLPYTIRFDYRVTESRYPHGFSLDARGDLTGRGIWTLQQDGPWVSVTYDWTVSADKPLLRRLSFLLKPIFRSNHNWTMRKGEESMRLELTRRRARTEDERARVPAPPRPFSASPVAVGLGLAGAVAGVLMASRLASTRHQAFNGTTSDGADGGAPASGTSTGVEVAHTVVIGRPIEEVFGFLTNLDNERRWQPDIQQVGWTTDGRIAPGSRFREVRRVMGRRVEMICEVTEFEPSSRFCIKTVGGELSFTSCRIFEATAHGTRTTQATDVHLRGIFKLFAPYVARSGRKQLAADMATLKSILEAQR